MYRNDDEFYFLILLYNLYNIKGCMKTFLQLILFFYKTYMYAGRFCLLYG